MRLASLILLILILRTNLHALVLNLKQAEEIALQENKPYLIAFEDVYQADMRRKQAISEWLPKITYSALYAHTPQVMAVVHIPEGSNSFTHDFVINRFDLVQPLLSTNLLYGLKSKKLQLQNSEAEKEDTKNHLLLKIRKDYFSVVLYDAALDIQKENINYLTEALEVNQGKFQNGDFTILELNQSRVAVSNALSEYYTTLQRLKEARNSLVYTLGVDPIVEEQLSLEDHDIKVEKIEEIKQKLEVLERKYNYFTDQFAATFDLILQSERVRNERKLTLFSHEEVDDYLDTAYAKRPDLRSKRLQIDIAQKEVETKYGDYVPQITGFVGYVKNGGLPQDRFVISDDMSLSVGVKLSWNLFDGFLRENKIKEAVSKRRSSSIDYSYARDNVEITVRNQLHQIEDALYVYISGMEGVRLAEMAMVQAKEKLRFGKIPPLEYRDTVNQLAKARNIRNFSSYQLMIAYYQLMFDIGDDSE